MVILGYKASPSMPWTTQDTCQKKRKGRKEREEGRKERKKGEAV